MYMYMHMYMMVTILILFIHLLLNIMFISLLERKVLSISQSRKGPNKISVMGALQPLADGMKLLTQTLMLPMSFFKYIYMFLTLYLFMLSIVLWGLYTKNLSGMSNNMVLLSFISLLSLSVYSFILMGQFSKSSFMMISSIRTISQNLSYEINLSFLIILTMVIFLSMSDKNISYSMYIMMPILLMLILVTMLMEMNRSPFDHMEAESELVSGLNTEFNSLNFSIFMMYEYNMMMYFSFMMNFIMFNCTTFLMYILLIIIILMVRSFYPRIRYDLLLKFSWIYILPITLMLLLNLMIMMNYI